MAISPASDIVLDVVRAAEPETVAAARARLEKMRLSPGGSSFDIDQGMAPVRAPGPSSVLASSDAQKKPFVEFEAMVLQTFLESMLPKDSESVYGAGLAGDMWKSLMAQEMSRAMADAGGIGIADRVYADFHKQGDRVIPLAGVNRDPGAEQADQQDMLATALVQELQRMTTRKMGADQSDDNYRGGQ